MPLAASCRALPSSLETDDVLGHHAEDRRMQAGMRKALDLVDVVVGAQFSAAGFAKSAMRSMPFSFSRSRSAPWRRWIADGRGQ